jgi:hypothetical protein
VRLSFENAASAAVLPAPRNARRLSIGKSSGAGMIPLRTLRESRDRVHFLIE